MQKRQTASKSEIILRKETLTKLTSTDLDNLKGGNENDKASKKTCTSHFFQCTLACRSQMTL